LLLIKKLANLLVFDGGMIRLGDRLDLRPVAEKTSNSTLK